MSQYLALAENVIDSIKEEEKCETDRKIFFTLILLQVRKYLKTSNLKLNQEVCTSIFSEEQNLAGVKSVDLSLIPQIDNRGEFLLWLAGFIEHITIDENKEEQLPLSVIMRQSEKIVSKRPDDFNMVDVDYAKQIKDYFSEPQKKPDEAYSTTS